MCFSWSISFQKRRKKSFQSNNYAAFGDKKYVYGGHFKWENMLK